MDATYEKPRIAFFGATGGCTLACLAPALEAGFPCVALARTPSKLTTLLTNRGIPSHTISNNLTIIPGSSTDIATVTRVLTPPPNLIICGVGGAMDFSNPLNPHLDNPTICQDTIKTILQALASTTVTTYPTKGNEKNKPYLVTISSTGISDGKRDVPLAFLPLYHWVLKEPHVDKKVMETTILAEMKKGPEMSVIRDYLILRPSFLTDGKRIADGDDADANANAGKPEERCAMGMKKGNRGGSVRVGKATDTDLPVGYTISREDVGWWMFRNAIERGMRDDGWEGWGDIFVLTY